jgi:hypothetical protein
MDSEEETLQNEDSPMEDKSNGNGVKFSNGTLLYWKFENGNFWGSIKGHKDGIYKTSWSDGDVHNLKEDVISSMVYRAQKTLANIPDKYNDGTRVQKYFEDEGGWWKGAIVSHDRDHNYNVKWNNGRLEQWNALYTVAMIQDAVDFPMQTKESKEETEGEVDPSSISIHSNVSSTSYESSGKNEQGSEVEGSEKSREGVTYDEDDSSITSDIGDAIHPASLLLTEEGLEDYLRQIDGVPHQGKGDYIEHHFHEDAIYHANITIDNSSKREIPIPILVPDSLVDWAVRIYERDINFTIRLVSNDEEIVESHYIRAKEADADNGEEGMNGNGVRPTESGQFTVKESDITIILVFDNQYSWFREKSISYHVTVTPPKQPATAHRAEKSLPYVLKSLEQAKYEVNFARQGVTKAAQNVMHTRNRFRKLDSDIDLKQQELERAHINVENFEGQRIEEEQRLLAQRKRLSEKTIYIQKVEQIIQELEQERYLCWKEKQKIENSIYDKERRLLQFDDRWKKVQDDAEELNSELCEMQIEVLTKDNEMDDAEKGLRQAEIDNEQANYQVTLFRRLADALKKRL